MPQELIMPKLGLTMTHGRVTRWLKKEGDRINTGEAVVEIETDKINSEVESPIDGYMLKILAQEGEEKEITAPICIIGEKDEPANSAEIRISPVAKKIAQENGIDYSTIRGTGPDGRIVKEDVLAAIEKKKDPPAGARKVPLAGMRKVIARRLSQSKHDIPHVYFKSMIDASKLVDMKNRFSETIRAKTGKKLSINELVIKAAAVALEGFADINTSLVNDEIIYHDDINIGMAVCIEKGLVVPVVKNANRKSLSEINKISGDLAIKAREGRLSPDDMAGGTFTVSNLGAYGIDEFTAIINPPESAILAVGRIKEAACIENGQIVVKPVMVLTLSVDHRVIDGALAAQFMKKLKDLLEDPYTLLI